MHKIMHIKPKTIRSLTEDGLYSMMLVITAPKDFPHELMQVKFAES